MFTATATRIQNLCPYHKKVKVIYSGRGQNNNKTGQGQGQGQNHKLIFSPIPLPHVSDIGSLLRRNPES